MWGKEYPVRSREVRCASVRESKVKVRVAGKVTEMPQSKVKERGKVSGAKESGYEVAVPENAVGCKRGE